MQDKDLEDCLPDDMIDQIVGTMDLNLGMGSGDTVEDDKQFVLMLEGDEAMLRESVYGPEPPSDKLRNLEEATTVVSTCSLAGYMWPETRSDCEQRIIDNRNENEESFSEKRIMEIIIKICKKKVGLESGGDDGQIKS